MENMLLQGILKHLSLIDFFFSVLDRSLLEIEQKPNTGQKIIYVMKPWRIRRFKKLSREGIFLQLINVVKPLISNLAL